MPAEIETVEETHCKLFIASCWSCDNLCEYMCLCARGCEKAQRKCQCDTKISEVIMHGCSLHVAGWWRVRWAPYFHANAFSWAFVRTCYSELRKKNWWFWKTPASCTPGKDCLIMSGTRWQVEAKKKKGDKDQENKIRQSLTTGEVGGRQQVKLVKLYEFHFCHQLLLALSTWLDSATRIKALTTLCGLQFMFKIAYFG